MKTLSDLNLPVFKVCSRNLKQETLWPWGQKIWLSGTLEANSAAKRSIVTEGHTGFLTLDRPVLSGKWFATDSNWNFRVDEFYANGACNIEADSYRVLVSSGLEIQIVLNPSLIWKNKAWNDPLDHDHCDLCGNTISSCGPSRYYEAAQYRVCVPCYQHKVSSRDLSRLHETID